MCTKKNHYAIVSIVLIIDFRFFPSSFFYASVLIQYYHFSTDVLGFKNTNTLTERVRPHINQAKRKDGQEHNNMGAAGIAKASWTPEKYLPPELYNRMSHDLALDEILTDAARRMFLERIVCNDVKN